MDDSHHPSPGHRYLAALSLRRTLTAARSLTHDPTDAPRGLPLPLLVLGIAIALAATTTTLWPLAPWLPWWALILTAPLAAAPAFLAGTIAMTPFLISTTRAARGTPTGHDWAPPTALTFLACVIPLLSPLPPWSNTLTLWALLTTAALVSTYQALPALGRDIDLERARADWDTQD